MGRPSIDITGRKFNRLTALRISDRRYANGAKIWFCECDCGKIIEVGYSDLLRGETKSCGCYRKEVVSLPKTEGNFRRLYRNYRNGASNRNLSFELSMDDMRKITSGNCAYCGRKPEQLLDDNINTGKYLYNGIDRKDNTKGYTLENSVPCCKICNFAKHTLSEDEFFSWIISVYNYRNLGV